MDGIDDGMDEDEVERVLAEWKERANETDEMQVETRETILNQLTRWVKHCNLVNFIKEIFLFFLQCYSRSKGYFYRTIAVKLRACLSLTCFDTIDAIVAINSKVQHALLLPFYKSVMSFRPHVNCMQIQTMIQHSRGQRNWSRLMRPAKDWALNEGYAHKKDFTGS